MNLTTLLANFALIKMMYVVFFLVLVVVINVSLSRRKKKNDDDAGKADIYLNDTKVCHETLDRVTSKN